MLSNNFVSLKKKKKTNKTTPLLLINLARKSYIKAQKHQF